MRHYYVSCTVQLRLKDGAEIAHKTQKLFFYHFLLKKATIVFRNSVISNDNTTVSFVTMEVP